MGSEYFVGYAFLIGHAAAIPTVLLAGDRIEYVNGRDYLRTDNGAWGSPPTGLWFPR